MPDNVQFGGSTGARGDRQRTEGDSVSPVSRSEFDAGERWRPKYGGVAIAAVGFLLTRFVVLTAIRGQSMPTQFLLSGGLALVFGLGVIVVGIALAVSTLPRSSVNTITRWCLVGVGGMALIAGLGVLEAVLYGRVGSTADVLASSQATNGLIGGAVGGVLVGVYSVKSGEYRRDLALNVDRVTLLNRIIRDKVLNKTTVIRANLDFLKTDGVQPSKVEVIDRSVDRMEQAVEEVGFLARADERAELGLEPVDLGAAVERSIGRARENHPGTGFDYRSDRPSPVRVMGNDHLETIFDRLFAAVAEPEGAAAGNVSVSVVAFERAVAVRVSSPGLSLADAERDLIAEGTLPEYDDPSVGFDLPIARLLVSQYGGEIDLYEDDSTTGISIALPRVVGNQVGAIAGIETGVDLGQFRDTTLASLVGGVGMGLILWSLTDALPAIGGLYGVQSLTIGWILHLFHSVVFGILFVGLLEGPLRDDERTIGGRVALGTGYGLALWLVAAGFVMPIWLNAVGIESAIPRLTLPSLLGHVTWGALLGGLYSLLTDRRRQDATN